MNKKIIIVILFFSNFLYSQNNDLNAILINYSYQLPIGELSDKFSNNSAIGINFLKKNKENFFYGMKASFIFGGGIQDGTIFNNINTELGYVIDGNGTYANIILLQEGFSSNAYIGYALQKKENSLNGIYLSFGLGILQHRINIETKNQYIPHLSSEYKKGYDQLTNGLSTHYNIDYMIIDDKNKFKIFTGINYTLAFTKNRRTYDFSTTNISENQIRFDQLLGIHFGIIIPINRRNNEEFHYF
mgnify:FL=1